VKGHGHIRSEEGTAITALLTQRNIKETARSSRMKGIRVQKGLRQRKRRQHWTDDIRPCPGRRGSGIIGAQGIER